MSTLTRPAPPRTDLADAPPARLPVEPLLPDDAIFDAAAVRADLDEAFRHETDPRARRAATVARVSAARKAGNAALEAAFRDRPSAARAFVAAQSGVLRWWLAAPAPPPRAALVETLVRLHPAVALRSS